MNSLRITDSLVNFDYLDVVDTADGESCLIAVHDVEARNDTAVVILDLDGMIALRNELDRRIDKCLMPWT